MVDRNGILNEMRRLHERDFARIRAELVDNVRTWRRKMLVDPEHGRM